MIPPLVSNQMQEKQMLSKRNFNEKESQTNAIISNNGINGYQNKPTDNKRIKLGDNNNNHHNNGVMNGFEENMSQCDDGYHDTNQDINEIDEFLNDEKADFLCSQAFEKNFPNLPINGLVISPQINHNLTRVSDQMIIDNEEAVVNEDVMMSTNSDQIELLDLTQGRNKILEAKNKKLEEEVREMKAKFIQNQRQKQLMAEEYKKSLQNKEQEYKSLELFRDNENKNHQRLIERLQDHIQSNSGIKLQFGNDFMKQKKNCLNFSQLKRNEFFSPLNITSPLNISNTQRSLCEPNGILVPDTQSLNSSQAIIKSQVYSQSNGLFKHPSVLPIKLNFSLPSEIAMTQMSTNINPITSEEVANTVTTSQKESQTASQSQNHKWESIRARMESKYRSNQQVLSNYFINQQLIGIFPDDWLRSPQDVIQWSQDLTEELKDYNITAVVKFQHLNEFISK